MFLLLNIGNPLSFLRYINASQKDCLWSLVCIAIGLVAKGKDIGST